MVTAPARTLANAHRLSYRYPARSVLSLAEVDLGLRPGRVTFVLGPNGSGKSTLFKLLLGLLKPISGSVTIDGQPAHRVGVKELARRISYIPQQEEYAFSFSVRDTVLMGRTPHLGRGAHAGPEDHRLADEAIATMGIEHLAGRGIRSISGGERQLTFLARALCQGGELLILDEPTASLDFANQDRVLREVRRLAGNGLGVLVSSHDPLHALNFADDLVLLRGGRIHWAGSVDQVREEHLSELYGIPVRIATSPEVPGLRVCVPVPGPPTVPPGTDPTKGHL